MDYIPNPFIIPVGLIVGILIAAPVGPVNVLCIQRAISHGVVAGIAAGSGAVLGDGLIAFLAALGVGAISGAIADYRYSIQFVGGIVLALFGIKLYFTKPFIEPPRPDDKSWDNLRGAIRAVIWDVPKTFLLTVTNPGAVLGLVAIFGGVSSFVEVRGRIDAMAMVAAIMAGSFAWWIALSMMIGRIRHRIDLALLRKINRVAGVLLIVFAGVLIGELVLIWLRLR
jgi:threonine/homoserine/homoserine lactone efflux protein